MQQESIHSNCSFLQKRQNILNTLYFDLILIVLSKLGYLNKLICFSWCQSSQYPQGAVWWKMEYLLKWPQKWSVWSKMAGLVKNGHFKISSKYALWVFYTPTMKCLKICNRDQLNPTVHYWENIWMYKIINILTIFSTFSQKWMIKTTWLRLHGVSHLLTQV